MSGKLRVLVVEDSEDDALLMLRELRKGGYEPDYERVDTKAAMMSALLSMEWDVIICDFNMPSFRGDHALSLLKESGLDVPFILLSGTIGEETAVDMMKAGAHDYIMKNNLARLVPAIQRELREAKNRQERREAEVALRQSQEQYRTILQSMNDLVFVIDKHDCYSQCYTSREELLFVSPKEFMGRHVSEVLPPSEAERFVEFFQRVRESGSSETFDYQLEIGGQKHWFSAVLSLQEDGESIVQVVRDITRRKKAEDALREERDKAQMYLDIAGVMLVALDADGRVTLMNRRGCEILGYDHDEIVGKDWFKTFLPKRFRKETYDVFRSLMKGKAEPVEYFENPVLTKDGEERIIAWHNTVMKNSKGQIDGVLSSGEDITERKKAEEALRESEEWFRAIYEESPIAINVFNSDGNLIHANPALIDFAGVSSVEELRGFNIFEDPNMPEDIKQRMRKGERVLFQSAIDFSKVKEAGLYDTSKSGVCYVETGASPLRYGEDEFLRGYMVQMVDVTDRRKAEEDVKAAAETAMLYLDLMGHDIRNHLQAIIMGTEILEQLEIRPEVREMVDIVVDSVGNSQNLIKKVQATRDLLSVPLSSTPLREALEDCLQVLNETYDNVQIEVNLAARRPTVFADKYLGNLLMNILENAILHNDKKTRRVWLDLREAKEGYEVVIADNGPGLASEMKESLFDQSRRFGGVGVHQAFKIIQKYRGHITVQDRVSGDSSKGAEFHIWFPKSTL